MSLSPAAKKTTIGATAVAIAMGEKWRGGASEGGRGGREREQVIVEEAAFEIFIPCRLMALSAVDRMELGKRGEKEGRGRTGGGGESFLVSGRRAALCRGVLWRGRGQNIFWKEATKGHYSDDGDERQKRRG